MFIRLSMYASAEFIMHPQAVNQIGA